MCYNGVAGSTLGLGPVYEKQRYNATSDIIGWAHTQIDLWIALCYPR